MAKNQKHARRGRPAQDKEKMTFTVDRSVFEAFQRLPEGKRSQVANLWLKEALKHKTALHLYEDGAGQLFLHKEGAPKVYQTDPYLNGGANFEEECQAIHEEETGDWSEEWVHEYDEVHDMFDHPGIKLIATWFPDQPYQIHCVPGSAGKDYLKLSDVVVEVLECR